MDNKTPHQPPAHPLLDFIIQTQRLKNDAALCRLLKLQPALISKIRHGHEVSPDVILTMHERLGTPVSDIRALIALKKDA